MKEAVLLAMRPLLALAASVFTLSALAQAPVRAPAELSGLQVMPTRAVFGDRVRTAALTLVNNGTRTTTYRISFTELTMSENGDLVNAAPGSPAVQSAASMVRFSPRQVTLEPGVTQTVRLQLRLPADLAAGEYRSHLLFSAIPDVEAPAPVVATTTMGVQLKAVYGVSIPVIVRHGETSATVALSGLSLQRAADGSPSTIAFQIDRSGNASSYTTVTASFISSSGKQTRLAEVKGVGVYPPNALRKARLPWPANVPLEPGRVRLRLSDPEGPVLAEAELPVR